MTTADLQTAQNRMFSFIEKKMEQPETESQVSRLYADSEKLKIFFAKVKDQLFDVLSIPEIQRSTWNMGITDSGKKTIELLVSALCPNCSGKNALVNTENYVAFNKFSAATILDKQKGVVFERPFHLKLGKALTVNSEMEFEKLETLFKNNTIDTLWIGWNSTSTGVQEKVESLVRLRNKTRSQTLIIADAASMRLFTNDWENIAVRDRPDVYFFSLRKQGIPYEGPQDEVHQAKNSGAILVFNHKAKGWARTLGNCNQKEAMGFPELLEGPVENIEQRVKQIRHLVKLDITLDFFLGHNKERIKQLDTMRNTVQTKVLAAFKAESKLGSSGFSLFSDRDAQSYSSYVIKVPQKTPAKSVISRLKEKGVSISLSKHPEMDSQQFVRFAYYPGNTIDEVDYLLREFERLAEEHAGSFRS